MHNYDVAVETSSRKHLTEVDAVVVFIDLNSEANVISGVTEQKNY